MKQLEITNGPPGNVALAPPRNAKDRNLGLFHELFTPRRLIPYKGYPTPRAGRTFSFVELKFSAARAWEETMQLGPRVELEAEYANGSIHLTCVPAIEFKRVSNGQTNLGTIPIGVKRYETAIRIT